MFRTKLPAMINPSLAFRWHSLTFIPDGERKLISPGGWGEAVMKSQGVYSLFLSRIRLHEHSLILLTLS